MKNITNAEYRKHPALSRSDLALLLQSPNDFWNVKYNGKQLEQTQAMLVGSEIHAFLEGAEFKDLIVLPSTEKGEIKLEGNGMQRKLFEEYKESPYFKPEEWDIYTMDDKGRETYKFYYRFYKSEKELPLNAIGFSNMKKLEEMINCLKKQDFYHEIVLNPNVLKEQTILFKYQGLDLKVRMDGFVINHTQKTIVIYDYKSTASLEPYDLLESIKLYAYNLQAYMYMLAVSQIYPDYNIIFRFIFQGKQNPNNCRIIEMQFDENYGNETLQCLFKEAKAMFEKAIEVYKEYSAKGFKEEWLNKSYIQPLDCNHNALMRLNNNIIANKYPYAGNELLYDFESAKLNCYL